jgi:hypothetical protein
LAVDDLEVPRRLDERRVDDGVLDRRRGRGGLRLSDCSRPSLGWLVPQYSLPGASSFGLGGSEDYTAVGTRLPNWWKSLQRAGHNECRGAFGNSVELERLLAAARDADGLTRIEYRDPIAAYGREAIRALANWLSDPTLAGFAVRAHRWRGQAPNPPSW